MSKPNKTPSVFGKNTKREDISIKIGLIIICLSDLNNNIFPVHITENTKNNIL